MDEATLNTLVEKGDCKAFMKAYEASDPSSWAALSKPAVALERTIRRSTDTDHLFTVRNPEAMKWRVAVLAVLAFGPKKAILPRSPGELSLYPVNNDANVIRILERRRPDWVLEWFERSFFRGVSTNRLSDDPSGWSIVRAAVRKGLCPQPEHEGYYQLLAWTALTDKVIKDDPGLLDHELWGLFRHHTVAFHTNDDNDRAFDWIGQLTKLAKKGRIDRDRLLDACLGGLSAGIEGTLTLSGFLKLFEAQKPTLAEVEARQAELLPLLDHERSPVVTFAVRHLAELEKGGALNRSAFVRRAGKVFTVASKGQPLKVLQLLNKVLAEEPRLRKKAVAQLTGALHHESVDVQRAGLELLETYAKALTDTQCAGLRDAPVRAELRARLDALSGAEEAELERPEVWGAVAEAETRDEAAVTVTPSLDLGPRAQQISEAFALDAAERAVSEGRFPPAYPAPQDPAPVLPSMAGLTYAKSVEDLLGVVSRAVEADEAHPEVAWVSGEEQRYPSSRRGSALTEMILDGISRFAKRTPKDKKAAARLAKQLQRYDEAGARAMQSWLDPTLKRGARRGSFAARRAAEARDRALAGKEAPVLSTPTHPHGWIDAAAFLERLDAHGAHAPLIDLGQALLRLHPSEDSVIRERSAGAAGDAFAALRFAIGEDEAVPKEVQESKIWGKVDGRWDKDPAPELTLCWICARRARGRRRIDPHVLDPVFSEDRAALRFGRDLSRHYLGYDTDFPAEYPPLTYLELAQEMASRSHLPTSEDDPHAALLEPLSSPALELTPSALTALSVALFVKDAEANLAAIDVLAQGIAQARVHPDHLAPMLTPLSQGDWAPLSRLAPSLERVAAQGGLEAMFVAEVLDRLAVTLDPYPKGIHTLFELWVEVLHTTGGEASEAAKAKLSSLKGSSKVAKGGRTVAAVKAKPKKRAPILRRYLGALRERAEERARPSQEAAVQPNGVPVTAVWSFKDRHWEHGPVDREGRLHGRNGNWALEGRLLSEVEHRHGTPHGEARFYHEDGSLRTEGRYDDGRQVGTWTHRKRPGGPALPSQADEAAEVRENFDGEGGLLGIEWFAEDGTPLDRSGQPLPTRPKGVDPYSTWDPEENAWVLWRIQEGQLETVRSWSASGTPIKS